MTFSKSTLLSKEEIKAWSRPNLARTALDLSLIWAQIVVPFLLFCYSPNLFTATLAFIMIAGGQHGLALASHEFVHYTAIPHDRSLNDRIGVWLFAAPIAIPLQVFRERHFAHHRLYSSEDDTKTNYKTDVRGARLWIVALRCLSGFEYVSHVIKVLGRREAKPEKRKNGAAQLFGPILICQLVIFNLFNLVSPLYYLLFWILPLITLAQLLYQIRALMEHQPELAHGCPEKTGYFRNTPGQFVRTVRASAWERLFLSHLNFGFHAEHHLWPQLSYQHLPKVREKLEEVEAFEDPSIQKDETYASTLIRLWREA